jgi:hypothetical protein
MSGIHRTAVATVLGVLCACSAAIVWAIDLTTWQPLTEPAKPWHDVTAENNTYWARDLRYFAIILTLASIALVLRGGRCRALVAGAGAIIWTGIDVWLDRVDLVGSTAAVVLATVASLVLVGASLADRRRPARRSGRTLAATAGCAAALAPLIWALESTNDHDMTASGVVAARVALGVTAAVITFACTLAAARNPTIGQLAGLTAVIAATTVGFYLAGQAGQSRLLFLCGIAGQFTAIAFVTSSHQPMASHRWRLPLVATAYGLIGYPVLALLTAALTPHLVPVGGLLTWLAGNPPVNAADSDLITALCGLVTGAGFALLLARSQPHDEPERNLTPQQPSPGLS